MPLPNLVKSIFAIVAVAAVYGVYIALSPPGQGEITDEEIRPNPRPIAPDSPIKRLRLSWNSKSYADWPVSETLASISAKAYLTPAEAEAEYRALGFETVRTFVDASMLGYVVSTDDVVVIVFRGTDDGFDWLVNLNSASMETPHGAIHRGFYLAYQPLKPQILELLEQSEAENVWITGHSLGGALALVCAYDFIENEGLSVNGIMTFGQPMVAREQLADHIDSILVRHYARYVNGADIVTRVPPGHTHCGSLVWFTEDGIMRSSAQEMTYGAPASDQTPTEVSEGPPPLSEAEFEQLKAELRTTEPQREALPDGTPVYGGNSPWIRDHSMSLYLDQIHGVFEDIGEK